MNTTGPALVARGLGVRIDGAAILRGIDLELRPGAAVALVGRSGSGKSTLARALVGLEPGLTGSLRFGDHELVGAPRSTWAALRSRVQLVWQDPTAAMDPHLTIRRILAETRTLAGRPRLDDGALRGLLERVELDVNMVDRRPAALSGGQRQRAALARALAAEPAWILADEITSALDRPLAWTLVERLRELRAGGVGLVMITHDMSLLPGTVDEVLVLDAGVVVERGPVLEVLCAPRHATTRALVDAAPRLPATR